jgi:ATP-binding cassette subfamily B protein
MAIILRHLRPFIFTILFIILLTFGQVIADLSLPNYLANIVNHGIAFHNIPFILRTGWIMLIVSLLGITCAIYAGYLASRTALGVGKGLRSSLFSHITNFSLSEFDQLGTSSLITRTTNDVQQIQTTTFMLLRMMLRAPLMCIGGIVMAVRKDMGLSLILLSFFPVVIFILFFVIRRAMPLFRQLQRRLDKINLVLRENLVGIRIVRAFGRVGFEKKRFWNASSEFMDTSISINRLMAILNPSMMLLMNLLTIAIVWFASFRIESGSLLIGDMLAFIQYAMQIFMSLMMLTMLFVLLPRAFASAERIKEVLTVEHEITDAASPVEMSGRRGFLTFDNVTFRYKGAERPAVCNVSFTACPGEVVAIIGGTGAGKSTLINLIPRYYDVEKGSISIDGVDIRNIKQHDLRDRIGFVPQKAVIFSGTIEENIRLGRPGATSEEITRACTIAQAAEFVEQLPKGYTSSIAQGGTNLSGGQKQRLSIARAIVKKPEIYIFDDSFSALDFKTDAALQAALRGEIEGATVLIVAQRVTSILGATRILVMENGTIVGNGTHKELLKTNEVYREIVESQLSNEEIG